MDGSTRLHPARGRSFDNTNLQSRRSHFDIARLTASWFADLADTTRDGYVGSLRKFSLFVGTTSWEAALNGLLAALIIDADIKLSDVTYAICAGNTTMIHLLYELDPQHIRREPYIPGASSPPVIRAAEIGLSINTRGLLAAIPCTAIMAISFSIEDGMALVIRLCIKIVVPVLIMNCKNITYLLTSLG